VGCFDNTELLERMVLLSETTWTTSQTAGTLIYTNDINKSLCGIARNQAVMSQFQFYRADVELTFRLNTNQFYYGALMLTLIPRGTGYRTDERAVQDPTIIEGSMAEAVIKTMKYPYPFAWMSIYGGNNGWYPYNLNLDVLAPLTISQANMPTAVTIQLWARFTNIKMSYPTSTTIQPNRSPVISENTLRAIEGGRFKKEKKYIETQSSNSSLMVKYPKKGSSRHPADDPTNGTDSVAEAMSALSSITIGDAVQDVLSLPSKILNGWGGVAGLLAAFDKPNDSNQLTRIISEPSQDLFNTDIADSNVSVSMYKNRYVDPSPSRMPASRNYTLSDFARIPGLRQSIVTFSAQNQVATITPIQIHPTSASYKIPLDYACICANQYRGSIKVCLQFFTASFTSARFVVQYANTGLFTGDFPTEYDSGLSRVIDVKGSTVDMFTLPFLEMDWWASTTFSSPWQTDTQFTVTCQSAIASTDTTQTPKIYMAVWIAGGDDIQFAYPRVPNYASEWNSSGQTTRDKGKEIETQSAIGSLFMKTFPPIGQGCAYDVDTGFCTSESIGPMVDVAKRYSPVPYPTAGASGIGPLLGVQPTYWDHVFDLAPVTTTRAYYNYYQFRLTLFGAMRSCFLFWSGGYRYRLYGVLGATPTRWTINTNATDTTIYSQGRDGVVRLSVPQMAREPFHAAEYGTGHLQVTCLTSGQTANADLPEMLAAGDDLQFGWPVLPTGLAAPQN